MTRPSLAWVAVPLVLLASLACGPGSVAPLEDGARNAGDAPIVELVKVPRLGTAQTFEVAGWNIQWFGNSGLGPTDEQLQLENVRDVVLGADIDLWAVQEIANAAHFEALLAQLPGFAGLLSNDARVKDGATYYNGGEQKVGVIYRSSALKVRAARVVLGASASDFGGRPPLELEVTAQVDGAPVELVLLVMHLKAGTDADSLARRTASAQALKAYLDAAPRTDQKVMVVGDWNDDIDVSQAGGRPSPFAAFASDAAHYRFVTQPLTDANISSTVGFKHMIDHHLVSNELTGLVAHPTEIFRLDGSIASYGSTTSDHFPVVSYYGPRVLSKGRVFLNELLANEPGSSGAGEFVELVNSHDAAADLGGWTLSDATAVRHRFPEGTRLAAGAALVVFAGPTAVELLSTRAVPASSGRLALLNDGGALTLADASGKVVDQVRYTSTLAAADGVSMNRGADGLSGGAMVPHTARSTLKASPGVRVDGSPFGPLNASFLTQELEPNADAAHASGPVLPGQDVRGSLGSGDADWLQVELPAGRFDASVALGFGADVTLEVFEASQLSAPVLKTAAGNPRMGTFSAARAGTYYLRLSGTGGYAVGLLPQR